MDEATYECEYCGTEFRSPFAMAACEMQCEADARQLRRDGRASD